MSSPVRAFGAVGGVPRFITRGSGSHVFDLDGNEYVDLVMSWGPLIHGHAHPKIVAAVTSAAESGSTFGAPTELELRLAEKIKAHFPSIELLRFVSSGTEATMSALRVARAFTGREMIVKFNGCYHGHVDALLIQAGSGALTHGQPSSAGVAPSITAATRVAPYNAIDVFRDLMEREGESVAAVIVEPVAGNMGVVPPIDGFLDALRAETERFGALLIFDEVISGFRLGLGGAQEMFGITPDITCLGKIIGGGLPAAAFGGRYDLMELLSPLGPVYQAGTLSGNPIAMAAGLTALELLEAADYGQLDAMAEKLEAGLLTAAGEAEVDLSVNRCRSMLSPFFRSGLATDMDSAQTCDTGAFGRFFNRMLDAGVYLPPSQFETWMLSFAHSDSDVDSVVAAASRSLRP